MSERINNVSENILTGKGLIKDAINDETIPVSPTFQLLADKISSGKELIRQAIITKEVEVNENPTFSQLAFSVSEINANKISFDFTYNPLNLEALNADYIPLSPKYSILKNWLFINDNLYYIDGGSLYIYNTKLNTWTSSGGPGGDSKTSSFSFAKDGNFYSLTGYNLNKFDPITNTRTFVVDISTLISNTLDSGRMYMYSLTYLDKMYILYNVPYNSGYYVMQEYNYKTNTMSSNVFNLNNMSGIYGMVGHSVSETQSVLMINNTYTVGTSPIIVYLMNDSTSTITELKKTTGNIRSDTLGGNYFGFGMFFIGDQIYDYNQNSFFDYTVTFPTGNYSNNYQPIAYDPENQYMYLAWTTATSPYKRYLSRTKTNLKSFNSKNFLSYKCLMDFSILTSLGIKINLTPFKSISCFVDNRNKSIKTLSAGVTYDIKNELKIVTTSQISGKLELLLSN